MTGHNISTARQREHAALRKKWDDNQDLRRAKLKAEYGAGFKGFDDLGEPIIEGIHLPRAMRAPELIRALERAYTATGDPVFDDAIRAIRSYGLDRGGHKRVADSVWPNLDDRCLDGMRYLVECKRMSSHAASEHITCDFDVPGASFEAAAERLRAFSI